MRRIVINLIVFCVFGLAIGGLIGLLLPVSPVPLLVPAGPPVGFIAEGLSDVTLGPMTYCVDLTALRRAGATGHLHWYLSTP